MAEEGSLACKLRRASCSTAGGRATTNIGKAEVSGEGTYCGGLPRALWGMMARGGAGKLVSRLPMWADGWAPTRLQVRPPLTHHQSAQLSSFARDSKP